MECEEIHAKNLIIVQFKIKCIFFHFSPKASYLQRIDLLKKSAEQCNFLQIALIDRKWKKLTEDILFKNLSKTVFLFSTCPICWWIQALEVDFSMHLGGGGISFPPPPWEGGGGISNLDQGQLSPFKQIYAWQRLDQLAQFSNATAKRNF